MSYKTRQEAGRSCPNDSIADTKIVEELPQMRRETVHLARQAVSEGRRAYVLVNKRAEGNAPLTVQALSEMQLLDFPRFSGHCWVTERPAVRTPRG